MSDPSGSKWNHPGNGPPPPARPVKREPPRIPSPTPSCMTSVTTLLRPGRPTSPTPSCSTVLLGEGGNRGQISIRPFSAILDPDDQMSTVSSLPPKTPPKISQAVRYAQLAEDSNDWRYSITTVGARLKHILENDGKYQDVTFAVEGANAKEHIKAHKLILRIASPVFDRIFQEAEVQSQMVVPVKDVEPEIFKLLLKYIYTDVIDKTGLNENNVLPLLQAAKIYGVRHLYLECVKLFKKSMSDEVAVKLCELASSYGDKLLLETALDHIANKAFAIFPSDDFVRLSQENVLKLFKRDDLRVDEITLFEAAVKWGRHKCQQQGQNDDVPAKLRRVMQPLIPEIRFPLMDPGEFTLVVTPTNLLTPEEQVGIYQYLSVERSKQDKLPPISFKTTPRRSKKASDFDSDSYSGSENYDSDYRDLEPISASTSPEQNQQMPSTSANEFMDVTTEGESETASNVSAYSDSRCKARKLERTFSNTSSASSSKRRKVEEANLQKSIEKPTYLKMSDFFGDIQGKCVLIENMSISLNAYLQHLSRNENNQEIESIKLMNVTVKDSKSLDGRKICFPSLKYFELNIQIDEPISSIISEDNLFQLKNYLFFTKFKHSPWDYGKLWEWGVEVTVIINKVIVLRLSHENGHVTLNKFFGASRILRSLKDLSIIKSVVYAHQEFPDKYFPSSMHRMVILGSVSSQCMSGFIRRFKHLKELTVVPPATHATTGVRALTLDAEFTSKDKIRKLGLGNFKLHLEPTIRFYNIVTLSLWRVTWESYFEEKFHHTFPKLKELLMIGPLKTSAKLLRNILKINTLTEITTFSCDFRLDVADAVDMRNFLQECGVSATSKSFVMNRNSNDKKEWKGTKFNIKELDPFIYSKFEYEYIYEDIDGFTKSRKSN